MKTPIMMMLMALAAFAADVPKKPTPLGEKAKLELAQAQLALSQVQMDAERQVAPIRARLIEADGNFQSVLKRLRDQSGAAPDCMPNEKQDWVCPEKKAAEAPKPPPVKPAPEAAKPAGN